LAKPLGRALPGGAVLGVHPREGTGESAELIGLGLQGLEARLIGPLQFLARALALLPELGQGQAVPDRVLHTDTADVAPLVGRNHASGETSPTLGLRLASHRERMPQKAVCAHGAGSVHVMLLSSASLVTFGGRPRG